MLVININLAMPYLAPFSHNTSVIHR